MPEITSSEPDFLLASPQFPLSPGHFTLIYPAAAGKLTTERPGPRFRRQFLPISRKWPELEAAVAAHVGAGLPAKPYFFAGSRQHAPVFPGRSPAVLTPSFLRSLISSPGHANILRFSRAVAGRVGAFLPAKHYFFAGPRQHGRRQHVPHFPSFSFFYSAST